MADSSLYVRKAVVARWRSFAPLLALLDKERIYGPDVPANPARPFANYAVPVATPFTASCLDGTTVAFVGKVFANATDDMGAEERASLIAAQMAAALDAPLDLTTQGCPFPAVAHVTWEQTQVIRDPVEAEHHTALVSLRADVSS